MELKISVVVPTYKRPELLAKCLGCLDEQHFERNDFEVIVVSDGPDREPKLPANGRFITLARNSGPAAARNVGWKNAKASLIAFTDDDCLPDPRWLSALWSEYQKTGSKLKVAFSGKTVVPLSQIPTDYEKNIAHLETASFITANCAITKDALVTINGFDEQFTTAWREDSDIEFRLERSGTQILKVNEAVVLHPVRTAKWGVSVAEQKKTLFNALLYKKHPRLFRERIQRTPAWNYYLIIAGALITVGGSIFNQQAVSMVGLATYLFFSGRFIFKRLQKTSKTLPHISEMVVTSLAIPFASVYWTLYGAIKYRFFYY